MAKEAKMLERKLGAEACVVICVFKEGNTLTFQDAGRFPMPPDNFYEVMQNAHKQNLLGKGKRVILGGDEMSNRELEMLSNLEDWVENSILKTDWFSNDPLTEAEKQIMGMAVAATYHKIAKTHVLDIEKIDESVTPK
ncbi:hypothetical protein GP486_008139 [Trichoglossum hirsutum]|uniref:Uncharacterized protein n=1 Tax=Trichoglossum hirsutum TaxID=265104 RepID=A0A9P8L6F4_9PEZI|nr:hypothetical protein GP486_008139 [Trichoglossum hirsutum]